MPRHHQCPSKSSSLGRQRCTSLCGNVDIMLLQKWLLFKTIIILKQIVCSVAQILWCQTAGKDSFADGNLTKDEGDRTLSYAGSCSLPGSAADRDSRGTGCSAAVLGIKETCKREQLQEAAASALSSCPSLLWGHQTEPCSPFSIHTR